MANPTIVSPFTMTSDPSYLVIQGEFILEGKEPDGDSVRFIAQRPDLYRELQRHFRIHPSRDGSVQLRLEGVDAPELHYGNEYQPLGVFARNQLLEWMGFKDIIYHPASNGKPPTMVISSQPARLPGVILSRLADANGRPVSYILTGDAARNLQADGKRVEVTEDLLKQTHNYRLLSEGVAYYTVYTSTPQRHRIILHNAAQQAFRSKKGVWDLDTTSSFELEDFASLEPERGAENRGQLILPKLFRRCVDFLKAVEKGFDGNLKDWIIQISQQPSRNEDDLVILNDQTEVHLSDLIIQQNRTIMFQADLLDIVFVEK